MANKENNNNTPQPGTKPKPKPKPKPNIKPTPIKVPESCKLTSDGGLASPWMKLGYDMGLNLTAPRTPDHENVQASPKPIGQRKENTPVAANAASPKHKAADPIPPTSTPEKPKKAKNTVTPSKRKHSDARDEDISYWSSESICYNSLFAFRQEAGPIQRHNTHAACHDDRHPQEQPDAN